MGVREALTAAHSAVVRPGAWDVVAPYLLVLCVPRLSLVLSDFPVNFISLPSVHQGLKYLVPNPRSRHSEDVSLVLAHLPALREPVGVC